MTGYTITLPLEDWDTVVTNLVHAPDIFYDEYVEFRIGLCRKVGYTEDEAKSDLQSDRDMAQELHDLGKAIERQLEAQGIDLETLTPREDR
jgi:hypothetical protein